MNPKREEVFSRLIEDKRRIALPWSELRRLETFLGENFGINQPPDGADLVESIRATCGEEIAARWAVMNDQRAWGSPAEADRATKQFYNFICERPALLGLIHSTKRVFILDVAAFMTYITRELGLSGRILDVGCHAGYHGLWLATLEGVQVKGIDRSGQAIRFARERGKDLGLAPNRYTFDIATFPHDVRAGGYDLILSSDGGVAFDADSLKAAARLLTPNGLLVWSGGLGDVGQADAERALNGAGLSVLLADVTGGWDGTQFIANSLLVLEQGREPRIPTNLRAEAELVWPYFRDYANTPGRDPATKTQAYSRTTFCFGPMPGAHGGP